MIDMRVTIAQTVGLLCFVGSFFFFFFRFHSLKLELCHGSKQGVCEHAWQEALLTAFSSDRL